LGIVERSKRFKLVEYETGKVKYNPPVRPPRPSLSPLGIGSKPHGVIFDERTKQNRQNQRLCVNRAF